MSSLEFAAHFVEEDGFIDSPSFPLYASAPSTSSASDLPSLTTPPLPLTLHTGPNTLIHTPLSHYLQGNVSFNSFREQVLAIRDEHLVSLASNSHTPTDGSSTNGSPAQEQSQSIVDVAQQWRETLEEVNKLKPGLMRLEGKILRDQVNELREQIRRSAGDKTQEEQTGEDWVDEVLGTTGGQVDDDEVATVDDFADMYEVNVMNDVELRSMALHRMFHDVSYGEASWVSFRDERSMWTE